MAPAPNEVRSGMQEARSPASGGPGLLRRLSARQWRVVILVVVLVVVVVIVVAVVMSRSGGAKTEDDVQQGVAGAITQASLDAEREGGRIDLVALNRELDGERGNWVVDLASSDDRRTVGVAARQPDGPTCILVWSAVGGARSATVTDPVLPCVGRVALAAAG